MKVVATLALGACMATAFAGASFAQPSKMSDSDKAMMTKCQALTQSEMMRDKTCTEMMKKYPDMMKNKDMEKKSGK